MAPFDRYRTLDVVRGVVAAGAEERVTLYTGNDDHIVLDLLVPYAVKRGDDRGARCASAAACSATGACGRGVRSSSSSASTPPSQPAASMPTLLALDSRVTDCNSAFFDVAHDFAGCIPGCHEVLRRQGLLAGHLVPGPERDAVARPGRRDRPRLPRARRPVRRCLRRDTTCPLAGLTLAWTAPNPRLEAVRAGRAGAPAAAAGLVPVRAPGRRAQVRHAVAGRHAGVRCSCPTTAGGPTPRSRPPRSSAATPGAGRGRAAGAAVHLVEDARSR